MLSKRTGTGNLWGYLMRIRQDLRGPEMNILSYLPKTDADLTTTIALVKH
jgi:hypothetical protein